MNGASQSYTQILYAEIIVSGDEVRWYGLFSITAGKSSSFQVIGPLIVGLFADRTGSIRYGFLFLVAMLWAPLPVLAGVDVERGRTDARARSSGDDGHEAGADS
ncbi:autophagy-related protein 22-like protein [Lactarius hatsudake]|nr:autophagy-related protein 22-like protein [Lactarius hatsudake]